MTFNPSFFHFASLFNPLSSPLSLCSLFPRLSFSILIINLSFLLPLCFISRILHPSFPSPHHPSTSLFHILPITRFLGSVGWRSVSEGSPLSGQCTGTGRLAGSTGVVCRLTDRLEDNQLDKASRLSPVPEEGRKRGVSEWSRLWCVLLENCVGWLWSVIVVGYWVKVFVEGLCLITDYITWLWWMIVLVGWLLFPYLLMLVCGG